LFCPGMKFLLNDIDRVTVPYFFRENCWRIAVLFVE